MLTATGSPAKGIGARGFENGTGFPALGSRAKQGAGKRAGRPASEAEGVGRRARVRKVSRSERTILARGLAKLVRLTDP